MQIHKRLVFNVILLVSLLINSIGPAFSAWASHSNISVNQNEDAMLICTGKVMKWISFSAFEANGDVVEITVTSNIDDIPPCPLFLFDDYHQDTLLNVNSLDVFDDPRWLNAGLRQYLLLLGPQEPAFNVRAPPTHLMLG